MPIAQVTVPLATTGQAFVQLPQKSGLLVVSTHMASQRVGVAPPQPLAQT
jgi:hypothetical protein